MERWLPELVVIVMGAAIIGIVKMAISSLTAQMKLELSASMKEMVTQRECEKQHRSDAKEREDTRKDVQNHEERLNAMGA